MMRTGWGASGEGGEHKPAVPLSGFPQDPHSPWVHQREPPSSACCGAPGGRAGWSGRGGAVRQGGQCGVGQGRWGLAGAGWVWRAGQAGQGGGQGEVGQTVWMQQCGLGQCRVGGVGQGGVGWGGVGGHGGAGQADGWGWVRTRPGGTRWGDVALGLRVRGKAGLVGEVGRGVAGRCGRCGAVWGCVGLGGAGRVCSSGAAVRSCLRRIDQQRSSTCREPAQPLLTHTVANSHWSGRERTRLHTQSLLHSCTVTGKGNTPQGDLLYTRIDRDIHSTCFSPAGTDASSVFLGAHVCSAGGWRAEPPSPTTAGKTSRLQGC